MEKGLLLVLSGPSGTGKGTVCKALLNKRKDISLSVSCTTRSPRPGEIDGKSYFFKTHEEFKSLIEQNAFLEYADVFSNYYGTPKSFVDAAIEQGKDVLLEIDVQGALKVKAAYPHGVYMFLVPPSMEELENRIRSRGTETAAQIEARLGKANAEMMLMNQYDYRIVNDQVSDVVCRIEAIMTAERLKVSRYEEKTKE
jgi:guanylate kinase